MNTTEMNMETMTKAPDFDDLFNQPEASEEELSNLFASADTDEDVKAIQEFTKLSKEELDEMCERGKAMMAEDSDPEEDVKEFLKLTHEDFDNKHIINK